MRQDGAAARGEPRPVADVRDDMAGGHGVARAALAWGSAASSFQKDYNPLRHVLRAGAAGNFLCLGACRFLFKRRVDRIVNSMKWLSCAVQ